MKQPTNKVVIDEWNGEYSASIRESWPWPEFLDIAYGATKRAALKAAIKRLHRLAADAEKMLDKL